MLLLATSKLLLLKAGGALAISHQHDASAFADLFVVTAVVCVGLVTTC